MALDLILVKVDGKSQFLVGLVMKLIAPRIEEKPAKHKEKMVRLTEAPVWARLLARGGYILQVAPEPSSTVDDKSRSKNDGATGQKFILLFREICI